MDGDFRIDLSEIVKGIEAADVLAIYFPLLRKTLVVDTRSTLEDEPVVRIMPMVDSVEERLRSIRRLRPHLPRPEGITIVPWPKYVDSLLRLGVWDRLVRRLAASGHKGAVQACNAALDELRRQEREELANVITGTNYHTIWQRSGERGGQKE